MGECNVKRKTENGCNKPRKRLLQLPEGECVFLSASGARVVIRGGNLNNGANDGAFYVNVNNELTNANIAPPTKPRIFIKNVVEK